MPNVWFGGLGVLGLGVSLTLNPKPKAVFLRIQSLGLGHKAREARQVHTVHDSTEWVSAPLSPAI